MGLVELYFGWSQGSAHAAMAPLGAHEKAAVTAFFASKSLGKSRPTRDASRAALARTNRDTSVSECMSGVLCCVAVRFSVSRPACVRLPGGGWARTLDLPGPRPVENQGVPSACPCARPSVLGRERWMCWWSESPWLLSIPYGAFTFLAYRLCVIDGSRTHCWTKRPYCEAY